MADEHVPAGLYVAGSDDEAPRRRDKKARVDLAALTSAEALAALVDARRKQRSDKADALSASFEPVKAGTTFRTLAEGCADGPRLAKQPMSVLVLCSSALRCIEVMRLLQAGKPALRSVKLFAKHMKADEQAAFLRKTDRPAAVGTPGRVLALVQRDAALFDSVRLLVVDAVRDVKERNILDIPETAGPLLDLVYGALSERLRRGDMRIVFLA